MIVFYNSLIAKVVLSIGGLFSKETFIAFAVGPFVFITKPKSAIHPRLLRHERAHVQQWKRYWYIGFLPVYFYQVLRYGYWNAPLEVEARLAELG